MQISPSKDATPERLILQHELIGKMPSRKNNFLIFIAVLSVAYLHIVVKKKQHRNTRTLNEFKSS